MSRRQNFNLFYYSHIPLALLASLLTASISMVINSQLNWNVVSLVGLSTFLTYSIDNLIDWKRDKDQYKNIRDKIEVYHKITYLILPVITVAIILIILKSSNEFLVSILLLGAVAAMGTTRFANYRMNSSDSKQPIRMFFLNRIFISVVWSIVCIFVPLWYEGSKITTLTWHTAVYVFFIVFIYAVFWKLERSPSLLKKRLCLSGLLPFLSFLPLISIVFVLIDIFIGIRPLHNLINLLPPVVCILATYRMSKYPFLLRQKITYMTVGMVLSTSLSLIVHFLLS